VISIAVRLKSIWLTDHECEQPAVVPQHDHAIKHILVRVSAAITARDEEHDDQYGQHQNGTPHALEPHHTQWLNGVLGPLQIHLF